MNKDKDLKLNLDASICDARKWIIILILFFIGLKLQGKLSSMKTKNFAVWLHQNVTPETRNKFYSRQIG